LGILGFLFFFVDTVIGQDYLFKGRVLDSQTGVPLVAANVQIAGTYRGTISNENGRFQLEIKQFPVELIISYIGYQTKTVSLTGQIYREFLVELDPVIFEAEPIVVIAEDPGMQIMREVIRRKQEWIKDIQTYQAAAYSRLVLENDSGIVSISESSSDLFWDSERGPREIIKSKRQSSNLTQDQNFAFASYIPNLYDDDVEINGFTVIGPTHPDAFDFYEYQLEKMSKIDTTTIYHIRVIPISRLQPTFTGELTVLDHEYALFSADLKPSESILFPPPIKAWDLSYRQKFTNFGQKFWLPVDLWVTGAIKIAFPGLEFPKIIYKRIAGLSDYQINIHLPDSLYARDNFLSMDTLAVDTLAIEAAHPNPIPLSDRESGAYQTLDSSATLVKAFKPSGFLARFIEINDETKSDSSARGVLDYFSPEIWYNRVDGWHIGAVLSWDPGGILSVESSAAYNTGLGRGSYTFGSHISPFTKLNLSIGFLLSTASDIRYRSVSYSRTITSFLPLAALDDYFDYFWNKSAKVFLQYNWGAMNTEFGIAGHFQEHRSLQKTTDFNMVFSDFEQRPNPPIEEGILRSIEFTVQYGSSYIPYGIVGQKRFYIRFEKSLSGNFDFSTIELELDWRLNTFLTRRLLPNVFDIHVACGASRGLLPIQRFGIVDAGLTAFGPFGALKSLRNRPYEGEKYLAVFWEHNFRTVPFELLELDVLYKNGISLIVFGGHARSWISDDRLDNLAHDYRYINTFHHEIGLSISGIFDLLRVDLIQRIDRRLFYLGMGFSRLF